MIFIIERFSFLIAHTKITMITPFATHHDFEKAFLSPTEKALKSALMRNILQKVLHVAKLDKPVILISEMGAGKKRIAQIIHENSSRAASPFYVFYCLDLTEERYEEAFREQLHLNDNHFILKYEVIEKATKGILYLDQFSELPPDLMLNVIKSYLNSSNQLYRFSSDARPRLILSVNMESYSELLNLSVWQTILHLLDPYTIIVPPLRERKEDIPILIDAFLNEIKAKHSEYNQLSISENALAVCTDYSWPGNIRQLHNALLQGAVLSHGRTIESRHFPFSMNWQLPYEFDGNGMVKK